MSVNDNIYVHPFNDIAYVLRSHKLLITTFVSNIKMMFYISVA